jgi:hypothetical protein
MIVKVITMNTAGCICSSARYCVNNQNDSIETTMNGVKTIAIIFFGKKCSIDPPLKFKSTLLLEAKNDNNTPLKYIKSSDIEKKLKF